MSTESLELFKNKTKVAESIKERNALLAENSIMSDFKFIVGPEKKEVPAHKHVFASTSYAFFNLFYLSPTTDANISLPDIKYESFKEFIQYVYTDNCNVSSDNFYEILILSLKYDMDHLTELCLNELPYFNQEFTGTVLNFFEVWNNEKTIDSFLNIIKINPLKYINQENVEKLKFEHLSIILESTVTDSYELQYFQLAMMWAEKQCVLLKIKASPSKLRAVLKHLFFLIRFPTMNLDQFQYCSTGQSGLFTNEEIIQIILFIKDNGTGKTDFCEEKRITTKINIFVKTLSGRTKKFLISPFSNVGEIKKWIWNSEGIPVDQQRLIYGAKQLESNNQLSNERIVEGSTIHLVLRLRSCKNCPGDFLLNKNK